jgi:hypothetical protein
VSGRIYLLLLAVVLASVRVSPLEADAATLTERASAYVDVFERSVSSMVLEERYVQVVKLWGGDPPTPGKEPELTWRGATDRRHESAHDVLRRRQLLSDVLLVQPAGQPWVGYRDVAEVDGEVVRDRALRLQQLFLSDVPGAKVQLQRSSASSLAPDVSGARR